MALKFDVRDEKKIRVIVDTDAACEADDPFAIAHALERNNGGAFCRAGLCRKKS